MKKKPYSEYIDINKERTDYNRLCNQKSDKYTYYTDWEIHIFECLSKFKTPQDLYNFKRYCISRERTTSKLPDLFVTYIVLFVSLYIEKIASGLPLLAWLIFVGFALGFIIKENKRTIKESYFFKDLIEVIEKFENTQNQTE